MHSKSPSGRSLVVSALVALTLAFITCGLCRAAAGVSLGLFFGGVAFATLLVPPLVAGERGVGARLLVTLSVAVGIAFVWLTTLGEQLTFAQWAACSTALLAYAVAMSGLCTLLLALRFNAVVAAGTVTVAGLLWLSWPVWLSHALLHPGGDTLIAWLVPAHPLFAVNGVLAHFDTWDRYPLAYTGLTVLNQDVFYQLPVGVFGTVLLHGGVGITSTALVVLRCRLRRARVASPAGEGPATDAR